MQRNGFEKSHGEDKVCLSLEHSLLCRTTQSQTAVWIALVGAFILFPAKGLHLRRYLQLLDLLQQALQGRALVTRVLLPDGVLQTLQVGFCRLSLFKKLWRTGVTPCQWKATEQAASPSTSPCRSIFPTSLSDRWLKEKMRAETYRRARDYLKDWWPVCAPLS